MLQRALSKLWFFRPFRMVESPPFLRFAPYEINLYRRVLKAIVSNRKAAILPFAEGVPDKDRANFFLRHDIDTRECSLNMGALIDVDVAFGVRAGVYFRVDDQEYFLSEVRDLIRGLKLKGFEVGLHSLCYTKDDYLAEFRRETEKFSDEAGFRASSFTLHGLGAIRLVQRMDFIRIIRDHYPSMGYLFTDCDGVARSYHHVVHDCHWDSVHERRFLRRDFELEFRLRRGCSYLVLTHPCYWQGDGGEG